MSFLDALIDKDKGYTLGMWIVDKHYEKKTLGTGAPTSSSSSIADTIGSIAGSSREPYKEDVGSEPSQNMDSGKKQNTTRYILLGAMALVVILYFVIKKKK